ncbi:MAG: hypothetical protein QOI97_2168 [Pseudomonas sp.]|jgi:hypothetical protein|nr:hypothetical protein [Pseudomonas sp.]
MRGFFSPGIFQPGEYRYRRQASAHIGMHFKGRRWLACDAVSTAEPRLKASQNMKLLS